MLRPNSIKVFSVASHPTLLNKIQNIQNESGKLLLGGKKRDNVTGLLNEMHWLPLTQHYVFKNFLFVFQTFNRNWPTYLNESLGTIFLKVNVPVLKTSLLFQNLGMSYGGRAYGDHALSVVSRKLWHDLQLAFWCWASIGNFKTSLKTHLFQNVYKIQFSVLLLIFLWEQ